jgi:hypothetical protein
MSGRHETTGPEHAELPLRERMPEYLATFGAGLAVAGLVGALIGLLSSAAFFDAVGYTILGLGVVFLLAGGASGGGYTNMALGATGSLFGGRGRIDEDVDDPDVRRGALPKTDPMERLRKGLRPPANPRAFWQVIGGFAYIAVGVVVVELLA